MNTRRDSADGPEDIDARFAEIVAGLEQDAPLGQWPDGSDTRAVDGHDTDSPKTSDSEDGPAPPDSKASPVEPAPVEHVQKGPGPRDWNPGPETEDDEGHFEPPEPPPISPPRPATWGGIGLIVVGVVLLAVPGLLGSVATVALPLGLVSISGGIAWLLFRLRHTPPHDGDDDGAQL